MVGTKGIIKVSDKFFTDAEISRLSVVAPNVVLNIIKDYEVVEKKKVVTPDELRSIVKCNNPKPMVSRMRRAESARTIASSWSSGMDEAMATIVAASCEWGLEDRPSHQGHACLPACQPG